MNSFSSTPSHHHGPYLTLAAWLLLAFALLSPGSRRALGQLVDDATQSRANARAEASDAALARHPGEAWWEGEWHIDVAGPTF